MIQLTTTHGTAYFSDDHFRRNPVESIVPQSNGLTTIIFRGDGDGEGGHLLVRETSDRVYQIVEQSRAAGLPAAAKDDSVD